MLQQKAGLRSERLLRALAEVPREKHLGPGPWIVGNPDHRLKVYRTPDEDPAHIYEDVWVSVDAAKKINNGVPSGLTLWIDALNLRVGESVVHAGCGTGYYTALMAHVVGPCGKVIALELDPELAARADGNLVGFENAKVMRADASKHDPGPVDAILINAGATHPCPLWLDSLKPGGRLVFPLVRWPVGSEVLRRPAGWGVVIRIQRLDAKYSAQFVSEVAIFPCIGALDSKADRLLARAMATGEWGLVRSLRREPHEGDSSCWLHGHGYCFSKVDAS
jgi:protein-L-isoaspartate(D-aspartate) O-methyltransferase